MKFTALEEYGLRCILRLAQKEIQEAAKLPCSMERGREAEKLGRESETRTALTIGEIAASEGLTEQYAGKIVRVLLKAKLVASARGCKGGYRLARHPEEITLAETLAALGGRLFDGEVCGRYTGDRHVCVRSTDCAIRSLWRELQGMMDRVLDRTTLRDLVSSEEVMSLRLRAESEEAEPAPAQKASALVTVGRFTNKKKVAIEERTQPSHQS